MLALHWALRGFHLNGALGLVGKDDVVVPVARIAPDRPARKDTRLSRAVPSRPEIGKLEAQLEGQ